MTLWRRRGSALFRLPAVNSKAARMSLECRNSVLSSIIVYTVIYINTVVIVVIAHILLYNVAETSEVRHCSRNPFADGRTTIVSCRALNRTEPEGPRRHVLLNPSLRNELRLLSEYAAIHQGHGWWRWGVFDDEGLCRN